LWLFFPMRYFCVLFLKRTTMKFKMKDVHIGNMIHEELLRQGRTVNWFAKEIYCEKSNIYKMFKRKSIDLAQLIKVSNALDHNFLKDCYEEV
jgi:ribosome biogenesis protein Nip4